ncbi:MAG: exodeoxyribonuclease VII small subunit [Clostridia bacterium]
MPTKITFEKALSRLEEINFLLEKGDLSLDESIKLFEEGSKLSLFCYEKLETAKKKVSEISDT